MSKEGENIHIFNREKIGNLFIYLADNIDNLFLTKLIKLTYIIDEISVKETGASVTWMKYNVWRRGPVPRKAYYNLTYEQGNFFAEFIDVELVEDPNFKGRKITSNNKFDDAEFSDYEVELLARVISNYGHLSAEQLIEKLHEEETLWHKIVKEKNLQTIFDSEEEADTSPYAIELRDAIEDPFLKNMFDEMVENISFREKLAN